jgi:hypothetical protein
VHCVLGQRSKKPAARYRGWQGRFRADIEGEGRISVLMRARARHETLGSRALKALPVSLSIRGYWLAIVTRKSRALNPLVALFIEHLREIARLMPARPG